MNTPRRSRFNSWGIILVLVVGTTISTGCDSAGEGSGGSLEGFANSGNIQIWYEVDVPKGDGPFPTVILAPGSGNVPANAWRNIESSFKFRQQGYAVVRYDKRGTGKSGGSVVGVSVANSQETVPLLAADITAVIEQVLALPEVDTDWVGLYGLSQASWYQPIVMSEQSDLDFAVYQSAGAIPVGISLIFEKFSIHQGLPFDEATERFEEELLTFEGPLGFDQRPLLEAENSPMLFLLGEKDQNIPYGANRDEILRLADLGLDITLTSYPTGEHALDGIDYYSDLWKWLGDKRGVALGKGE